MLDILIYGLGGLILLVVLFMVMRNVMCWYYRINESIVNQQTTIELLKEISEKLNKYGKY